MSDERRPNPHDPTDERTAEQSTVTASGLTGGKERPVTERETDDPLDRDNQERYETPRRYEDETPER